HGRPASQRVRHAPLGARAAQRRLRRPRVPPGHPALMVNFLIITHGEFGAYLVEAAEEIVGRQGEGVRVVSISSRLSVDEITKRTRALVDELYDEREGLV